MAEGDSILEKNDLKTIVLGKPKNLRESGIFHTLALIPFLAWVGLGADGLSSSAYGPEEAFKTLSEHTYLAVGLVIATALTVLIISSCYSRIIEAFPHGGGGYVVASKLLGRQVGVISGCALLVDYVLTITVSIAAAGDALFSFMPPHWVHLKMFFEVCCIVGLTMINIRGVKESVIILAPIFVLFLITHAITLVYGVVAHIPEFPQTYHEVKTGFSSGWQSLGPAAMFLLFVHAYSLGGGTYTGIEAVSNGLPIMREPRVQTAKRTMIYMAVSLAITASGLILCYLLWHVHATEGKTMNAVLLEKMTAGWAGGPVFVIVTLITEGALLVVAAQAGFIDGPRVLSNMAIDSWMPHRFSALSERLTTANGIVLMGAASLIALLYTNGLVSHLVVMYSINVFLTFSLSIFGMLKHFIKNRNQPKWHRGVILFTIGFLLCVTILIITVLEKFSEGGWITLAVTAALVTLCYYIRRHYHNVAIQLSRLYTGVERVKSHVGEVPALDKSAPTAVVLVAAYGGLGIHTVQNIAKTFPGHFKNFVFLSIGVVDSGGFKGEDSISQLTETCNATLARYCNLANRLGFAADSQMSIGTDVVDTADQMCRAVAKEYSACTFFAGKIIFAKETWLQRILHNETAFSVQKRLMFHGLTMVILPTTA